MRRFTLTLFLAAFFARGDTGFFGEIRFTEGSIVLSHPSWDGRDFNLVLANNSDYRILSGRLLLLQYYDIHSRVIADTPVAYFFEGVPARSSLAISASLDKSEDGCAMLPDSLFVLAEGADGVKYKSQWRFDPANIEPVWYSGNGCLWRERQYQKARKGR